MAIIDFMKASINFTDYLDFTYFINCIDFVDINKLMILIQNEMKTYLFLKTFNVASTYFYRITKLPN